MELNLENGEQMDAEDLRAQARRLVDLAIVSGIPPQQTEAVLENVADGVQFNYEDAQRYNIRTELEADPEIPDTEEVEEQSEE